jgi:branched-chain amino acid transport system permease protein
MSYLIFSLSLMLIYVGLATLLHLQFGKVGIVNFGVVGFWGLGMYGIGVLTLNFGVPYLLAIALSTVAVGLVAALLGSLVLRLDGQGVLVATLAFSTAVMHLVTTEKWLTKGVLGLGTIPYPFAFGSATELVFLLLIAVIVVGLMAFAGRLPHSAYGRLLVAIRDNETLAASLGKPTFQHKVLFFALSSAAMGLFGGLSASLNQFLTPAMLSSGVTFTVWIALILGGKDKALGGLVGAVVTIGLFDILIETYAPIPSQYALLVPNLKLALYGLLLVAVLLFRPRGLLGSSTAQQHTATVVGAK